MAADVTTVDSVTSTMSVTTMTVALLMMMWNDALLIGVGWVLAPT